MKNTLTFLLLFLCLSLFGQLPPACPSGSGYGEVDCGYACVNCDFNGGMYSLDSPPFASQVNGFCGSIENNQWFAFIAGATSGIIVARPSNCNNGDGLQLLLSSDCGNSILVCEGGAGGNGNEPIVISFNSFVVGQTYYLMVDGFAGDVCDFTFEVSPAQLVVAPEVTIDPTILSSVQDSFCLDDTYRLCVPPVPNAQAYIWDGPPGSSINGFTPPVTILGVYNGNCADIHFGEKGNGYICVQAVSSCSESDEICKLVTVNEKTILPVATNFPTQLCPDESAQFSIQAQSAAISYTWTAPPGATINNLASPVTVQGTSGNAVNVVMGTTSGDVCVTVEGACGSSTPFCQFVELSSMQSSTFADTVLCNSLAYLTPWGDSVFASGTYSGMLPNDPCMRTFSQNVTLITSTAPTVLPPAELCFGDSLEVCGTKYSDPGQFSIACTSVSGCDSIVQIQIYKSNSEALILNPPTQLCPNLPIVLNAAAHPGDYIWTNDQGNILSNGTAFSVNSIGTYHLEIRTSVGTKVCSSSASVTLSCPAGTPCSNLAATASSDCLNTCLSCDLYGLSGSTSNFTAVAPTGFCGLPSQNGQWYAFEAGASLINITATPSNCTNGDGIQMALYQNCADQPLACAGGCVGCDTIAANLSYNALQAGQVYYLFISGTNDDICGFSLDISPSNATARPFNGRAAAIQGVVDFCENSTETYTIDSVNHATHYIWTAPSGALINGQASPVSLMGSQGLSVDIQFGSQAGVICVQAGDACGIGSPTCFAVQQRVLPATTLPDTMICVGDFPYTCPCGTVLPFGGYCECTYTSVDGCDSLVRRFIGMQTSTYETLPPIVLCGDECVEFCGEEFCDLGFYSKTCPTTTGCDLTSFFFVVKYKPIAEILNGEALSCPSLPVVLNAAPSGGTFRWYLNGQYVSTGQKIIASEYGIYTLEVTQSFGSEICQATDAIDVHCPSPNPQPLPTQDIVQENYAKLIVQPTISNGLYQLSSSMLDKTFQQIRVSNMQGRLVQSILFTDNPNQYNLNLEAAPQGIYVVSVFLNGEWQQVRVVRM